MAAFETRDRRIQTAAGGSRLRIPGIGAIAAAGLVVAAALLPVVQSSKATSAGYETRQLERRKTDLQASIYNAQSEIAERGSLEHIEREARGRLGMLPATRTVVLKVDDAAPPAWQVPSRFLAAGTPVAAPPATAHGWRGFLAKLPFR